MEKLTPPPGSGLLVHPSWNCPARELFRLLETPMNLLRKSVAAAHCGTMSAVALVASSALAAPPSVSISPLADPAADATELIAHAVEQAVATGSRRLVLTAGTYHVFPARAREVHAWISNHDDGLLRSAFPLWKARQLEIDGSGARLVLHGQPMAAFTIYDSADITLRNLTIDWDRPLFLQGRVVSCDEQGDYFDLEMLPECQARVFQGDIIGGSFARIDVPWKILASGGWGQNLQWPHWIDPATRRPLGSAGQLTVRPLGRIDAAGAGAWAEPITANRFRIHHAVAPLPAVGSALVTKGTLMPNRLSPAIHVARSRNVAVENVVVHHAGGMGLIAESSEDIVLRRYQVRLPEDSPRLVTTTADGSHFTLCRGRIVVEDCHFENMMDDSINVHSVHGIVEPGPDPHRVYLRFHHPQQKGLDFAAAGERIEFCRQEDLLPYAEGVVRSVRRLNEGCLELTFTTPVGGSLDGPTVADNASRHADLYFRRNVVRNNRARGALVTTRGKVVIEENRFEHSTMASILIEGDADVWCESGRVSDVVIRRNVFTTLNADQPAIRIAPKQPGVSGSQSPYHRNVRIIGNEFHVAGPRLVEAYRVQGLEFAGNVVRALPPAEPAADPASPPAASFALRDCQEVAIARNRLELPAVAWIQMASPTPGLVVRENTGLDETGRMAEPPLK